MKIDTISMEVKLEILDLICDGWSIESISIYLNIPENEISLLI
jgi:hypothetical protein